MAWSVFDVRRTERGRVARAGVALFFILAGFTISETARDSLFLASNGADRLAFAYLALAAVAVLALFVNAWIVRRVGRRNAQIMTLLAAAAGTAAFQVVPRGEIAGFSLYLWTGLLGTVVVVQFWLLSATRFTTAEAKRLYGPIAACGAFGTLVGAIVAWILLLQTEIETLLVLAAAFYLAAAWLLVRDNASVAPRLVATETRRRSGRRRAGVRGPYVVRLAILTICATASALLADWLLKSAAAEAFHTDELARFIARYNGAVAAISLVLQLVGAAWLVRKLGVLGMAMLLPAMMLVGGAASVLTAGSFLAIGFTKGADSSLRYSVYRVSTELLWMPVPDRVRTAVREPLESVVTRLVQAASAVFLLVLVTLDIATATVVAAALLVVALIWSVTAGTLRNYYLGQLRHSVNRRALEPVHQLDDKAIDTVVAALSDDDDRRAIAAIQILTARGRPNLIPALILRHDSIEVKAAALAAMTTPGRTDWVKLTWKMLRGHDPKERVLALRALARIQDETAIVAGLCDEDPGVMAHGVFWSLRNAEAEHVRTNPAVVALLEETGSRGETARGQLLEAIRSDGDARWTEVMLDLAAGDPATAERLALAIEHVPDPRFITFLMARLGTRAGRPAFRSALLAIGPPALAALEAALADPKTVPRIRLHIPSTIAMFGSANAAEILARQLALELPGAVRYRLLRALARMAVDGEIIVDAQLLLAELQLHLFEYCRLLALAVPIFANEATSESALLLRGLLVDKTSQALDRAFLALQSLHPREDLREIERAITGDDQHARSHGIELLDTLMRTALYAKHAEIRARLLMLGEELDHPQRLARMGLAAEVPPSVSAALVRLIHERDSLLSACAAYYAIELREPELMTAVDEASTYRPLFEPLGVMHTSLPGG